MRYKRHAEKSVNETSEYTENNDITKGKIQTLIYIKMTIIWFINAILYSKSYDVIFLDPRAYSFDGIQVSLNFLLNEK